MTTSQRSGARSPAATGSSRTATATSAGWPSPPSPAASPPVPSGPVRPVRLGASSARPAPARRALLGRAPARAPAAAAAGPRSGRLRAAGAPRRGPGRGPAGPGPRPGHAPCWPTRRCRRASGSAAAASSRSGRGRDGRPGLAEGFCRNCGTRFSFSPKLEPGELVAGQYEVLGCLAHGGLGWIYLARDHNVSDRWVVLKGLLNTGDADAMAAAVAERQFLAEVEHPNIVRIYNFVQHADRRDGETAGYIVMEYVGGKSLQADPARRAPGGGESLPLPTPSPTPSRSCPRSATCTTAGLVYCDFKPDNVIQTEEQLKLIDMGGVRRIDDDDSAIYGTVGYQAPEIADDGPVAELRPVHGRPRAGRADLRVRRLPGRVQAPPARPADVPLLARAGVVLPGCCAAPPTPTPTAGSQSAGEMAEQLTGVLREVLAVADGSPGPRSPACSAPSCGRSASPAPGWTARTGPAARAVPPPAAEVVAGAAGAAGGQRRPGGRLPGHAGHAGPGPADRRADSAAVAGDAGRPARGRRVGGDPPGAGPRADRHRRPGRRAARCWPTWPPTIRGDWRVAWYTGLRELAAGHPGRGQGRVRRRLRRAARRARAQARAGLRRRGRRATTPPRGPVLPARVDRRPVLRQRRVRAGQGPAGGRRPGPARSRRSTAVPETSSHHLAAQVAAVRIQVMPAATRAEAAADDLQAAGRPAGRLKLDAALPAAAHRRGPAGRAGRRRLRRRPWPAAQLLGCEPSERSLRFGLERSYRALARLAPDRRRRIELVDLANDVRPRTWS